MLRRMTTLLELYSAVPSAHLCRAAIGDALVELDAWTPIPLSVLGRQLDADVLGTVSQPFAAIPESVHIAITTETRPDGSRYLFTVSFGSQEVHTTEMQSRVLKHPLVESKFPPLYERDDIGILEPSTQICSPGIESGTRSIP
jgi:hypothetical protein